MSNTINPENIFLVCSAIKDELPLLIGVSAWNEISSSYEKKLDQLKNSTDELKSLQLSADLVEMIAPYPSAHARVRTFFQVLDPHNGVLSGLSSIVRQIGINGNIVAQLTMATSQSTPIQLKLMEIRKGGDKGKSIKLKNLEFDFGDTTGLIAGVITTTAGIVGETNYLLIAASVLLIVRTLSQAITIEISEQEASVFWGFIQVCSENKTADESKILKSTNEERKNIGLKPLNKNQLKNVLHKLDSINSIKLVKGKRNTWRIVEKYRLLN